MSSTVPRQGPAQVDVGPQVLYFVKERKSGKKFTAQYLASDLLKVPPDTSEDVEREAVWVISKIVSHKRHCFVLCTCTGIGWYHLLVNEMGWGWIISLLWTFKRHIDTTAPLAVLRSQRLLQRSVLQVSNKIFDVVWWGSGWRGLNQDDRVSPR